ncbi:glycosyltransferase family 2 protein [Bradyrhizobium ottawaense]|uniref:glycosyltransferase family 2 protein n=1 Tax=Bradyrhizobium ottawaense TaxID=931866 RepID=UPI003398B37A
MSSLAVIILTFNEELHLARALDGIHGVATEVFVVDSGSTDRTKEIAASYGATVIEHPFVNYAKQFQWALENAPITSKWVMRLDADEIVESDLAAEIANKMHHLPADVVGINLKRKTVFMNKTIKHGGRHFLVLLRIWRRGHGRIEDRWMDEHMLVSGGKTITFEGGFADHNLNNLGFFTEKHNKYATREAIDVLNQRLRFMNRDEPLVARTSSRQAAFKRLMKEKLYNNVPFELSTLAYFLYRFVFQLGFLDGKVGVIYHVLQGYWYRFLVGAKVEELARAIQGLKSRDDIRTTLSRLTGLTLQ